MLVLRQFLEVPPPLLGGHTRHALMQEILAAAPRAATRKATLGAAQGAPHGAPHGATQGAPPDAPREGTPPRQGGTPPRRGGTPPRDGARALVRRASSDDTQRLRAEHERANRERANPHETPITRRSSEH